MKKIEDKHFYSCHPGKTAPQVLIIPQTEGNYSLPSFFHAGFDYSILICIGFDMQHYSTRSAHAVLLNISLVVKMWSFWCIILKVVVLKILSSTCWVSSLPNFCGWTTQWFDNFANVPVTVPSCYKDLYANICSCTNFFGFRIWFV